MVVDLNAVRRLMGHADIKMTLRYAHLCQGTLAAAVAKLREGKFSQRPPRISAYPPLRTHEPTEHSTPGCDPPLWQHRAPHPRAREYPQHSRCADALQLQSLPSR